MSSERTDPNRKLGLAVVGCGRISQSHLKAAKALGDDVEVVAVVDAVESKARARAEEFGVETVYTSLDAALADERVEAVDICTQPVFHAPLGMQAVRAGRHALIEKPICLSLAELDALIAAGRENSTVVMSGQSRRFNDLVAAARRIIRAGEIGRLVHISIVASSHVPQGPPIAWWGDAALTGPNAFIANWASHWIDQVVYLAGSRPHRVYAEAADHDRRYAGADEWSILVRFADDLIASYTHSFNVGFHAAAGFAYCGTAGTLNIAGSELLLNGRKVEGVGTETNSFRGEIKEFADAIRQGRPPLCSAEEVRPAVAVCEAALVSARGHRMVTLAELGA